MYVTCSLLAFPTPTTACFTSVGVYSKTGMPTSAHASNATPLACPTRIAVRALELKKRRSIATASGSYFSMTRSSVRHRFSNWTDGGCPCGARAVPTSSARMMPPLVSITPKPVRVRPGSMPMTRMLDLPNICTRWSVWGGWDLFKELGSVARLSDLGEHRFRDVEVRVDALHVIVVFERFHQLQHRARIRSVDRHRVLRHHRDLRRQDRDPRLLQRTLHVFERSRVRDDLQLALIGPDVVRSPIQRGRHHVVLGRSRLVDEDHALAIEQPLHRTRLREVAVVFPED